MSQNEIEKIHTGAPDLKRQEREMEDKIRKEVDSEFPTMPAGAKNSIIESRLKIFINGNKRPDLIRVDLGENTSKKIRDELFE